MGNKLGNMMRHNTPSMNKNTASLKNNAVSGVIEKFYLNEDFADVHFQFNVDDDVQKIPANKNILAAQSAVFYSMFFGSLKEGNVVKIADASADAFKEFLQFFYLGEVTLTMKNIETVAHLADKYDVLKSVNACATFLESQLTQDNICWGYQLALPLKNNELIEFCENEIARMPKKIFTTDGFQQCHKSTLKRILDLENFNCKEIDILEACVIWAKCACRQNGLDDTKMENLRSQLGDCLQLIRFGAITSEEFSQFEMLNNGLFTSDEFKDIIFILTLKGYQPKMFNPNRRRLTWNENKVVQCFRISVNGPERCVQNSEIIWFTSNKTVLLGQIQCAIMCRRNLSKSTVNVIITEMDNGLPKKVLNESSSIDGIGMEGNIILSQAILIKPKVMYEIRLNVPDAVGCEHYSGSWKPTISLWDGLLVQFHRNPSILSYDTSSSGWIRALSFNIV